MSMKLEHITERVPKMEEKTLSQKNSVRKRYSSIMSSIYTLYIISIINLIALIALWVKVFFYMGTD